MKASDLPIHFWEVEFGAEMEATQVDYLLDIDFTVKDASTHGHFELVYLPSFNQPHYKKVVLYFLPFIRPDEQEPRIIHIRYRWNGFFRHLQTHMDERLEFSLRAKESIGLMEYEVYLEPGTGKKLGCEALGLLDGSQTLGRNRLLVKTGSDATEWEGWRYSIQNGPPGVYAMLIKLENA
jgi:hypothetical protein